MDAVKGWAISICMASLAGTIVYFISPSGNSQRLLKTLISVFFITVLVHPVIGISNVEIGNISHGYTYDDSYESNEAKIADTVNKQCIEEIKAVIGEKLREEKINSFKISVITDNGENSGIFISSVNITLNSEYKSSVENLSETLQRELGVKVNIYLSEE